MTSTWREVAPLVTSQRAISLACTAVSTLQLSSYVPNANLVCATLVLRRFSKQHQLRGATRTRDEQKAARCRRQDDAGDSAPSTAACRLPSELRRCCSVRRYKASVAFDSTCRDLITSATLCFERSSCSGHDLQRPAMDRGGEASRRAAGWRCGRLTEAPQRPSLAG